MSKSKAKDNNHNVKDNRSLEKRWGKEVLSIGYSIIPSVLLRAQERLHIDCVQLAVLMQLIDHWWEDNKLPYPSKSRLSKRIGKSEKTIQRAISGLEKEGLLSRRNRYTKSGGQASNYYDLNPLAERLEPIAKEMLEANAKAKEITRSPERPGHNIRKKIKNQAAGQRHA